MIAIKDGNKTRYFANQADADNYNDYLQNGLKVIRTDNRTYHFNNGGSSDGCINAGRTEKALCFTFWT